MLTGCSEYRPRLIELARGMASPGESRIVMAHVESCADCARVLDEQSALTAALGGMAAEAIPEMAEIETRVLAEFDRARWSRRFRLPVVAPLAMALAAAGLIALVAVNRPPAVERPTARVTVPTPPTISLPVAVPAPQPAVTRVSRVRQPIARRPPVVESQPFVPIPYTVPLAPEERATVVHMVVPVAALIAAGFNVSTSDPGGVVDADVLVSQDGRARAIRFNSK